MRLPLPVRIVIGATLTMSATIGTLDLAVPSGAVTYTTCGSLSGVDLSGQVDTIGGCTGPTGGSGTISGPLTSPVTVSWSGGGTTTISFTTKTIKRSKCPAGSAESSLTGHATASTGPAQEIRGMFFAKVCVGPDENLSLVTGKPMLLQS
jgi:hypothetical protein